MAYKVVGGLIKKIQGIITNTTRMEEAGSEHKLSKKKYMNRFFTSRFWIIVVIAACGTVCLASEPVDSNWYTYSDNFQNIDKLENDSLYHSIFWPQGAFPPSEPYLYLQDYEILGFGGFKGQDYAQVVYHFPLEQEQYIKTISGEMKVDVFYPYENSDSKQELLYSLSSDGLTWSKEKKLNPGSNIVELESIRGICYIKFSGIGVLIDNLQIVLNQRQPDRLVPSQYPTIQAAIDDANEGDIIEVASRSQPYTGIGNTNIDFKGKSITIYGEKGPEQTIIDCENKSRGFYFHEGEDANSVVCGFTIRNARKEGSSIPQQNQNWNESLLHPAGAGIFCQFSSPSIIDCIIEDCSTKLGAGIALVAASPYIADCIIQNCNAGSLVTDQSGGYGAGIALIRDSNAVIVNTIIRDNKTYYNSQGAGVYCHQSNAVLLNCEIRNNGKDSSTSGSLMGGGIYTGFLLSDIELRNCVVSDNNAQSGAGIFTDSIENVTGLTSDIICNVLLTNCTIANNKISQPQDTIGGGIHSLSSNIIVKNSIIWGNESKNIYIANSFYENPVRYSDVQGGFEGQNNIDIDPCFASPTTGDYHLKSKDGRYDPVQKKWVKDTNPEQFSQCIDAGDTQDEIGPEPFPHGDRINLGAYGGTEQASMNSLTRYVFHVSKTGSDSNSGLSKDDAFRTIQKAVDMTIDGDIVLIWPGTYQEEVTFKGRAITVQSADEAAIVTANHGGYAFTFSTRESRDSVLRNLIIANCNGEGAIYCSLSFPTLINLTIVNNRSGIRTYSGASPIVKNCIFLNNLYGDYDITDPYILSNISYCRLGTLTGLADQKTNFIIDPGFKDNNSDFHLKSTNGRYSSGNWETDSYNSPCIDAGDRDMSVGREPRPNNGIINIGAYGGTPYASKSNQ